MSDDMEDQARMAHKSSCDAGGWVQIFSLTLDIVPLYMIVDKAPGFRGGRNVHSLLLLVQILFTAWPSPHVTMKLSPALKSVINTPEARPGPIPAPPNVEHVFSKIEQEAEARRLGLWLWLAVMTATTMTMNSPQSMTALFQHSSASRPLNEAVTVAEFMREVGLRCIGINGVRTPVPLEHTGS